MMRRLIQKTLSLALMGMLLAMPFVLSAQGKKKGGGRGNHSGGRKKAGTRKKGGN